MKVLLDECVPRKLRREIANHEVRTVTESGWSGLKKWRASRIGRGRVRCLPHVDQNLIFQQNQQRFNIGIILMAARNNRFKTLLPDA